MLMLGDTAQENVVQVGQIYGRLRVASLFAIKRRKYANCLCSCGKKANVSQSELLSKHKKSCGCLSRDLTIIRNTTHGMSATRIYFVWRQMISRCHSKNSASYSRYGARGIYVCDQWRYSFKNFFLDMGDAGKEFSIDRINNDGPYSPENCKWSTPTEQNHNNSRNKWLTINGETLCLSDWARRCGLSKSTIRYRIAVGVTGEKLISQSRR